MKFSIFNSKKSKYVKICPRCKSVGVMTELKSGWFIGLPASYRCKDCGMRSMFFPEIEIEEGEKDAKNKKSKNT
jgi:ssDNA-binding Zn-finger/Zn-ribbon topoisomerase 1